ncbi:MAG: hypothetical protein HQ461_08115 [Deltaproteobacteria bacterium]|nr:hypothetical protein [Deltaproteobacteria bacterium]
MATLARNLISRGSLISAGAPTRIAQALLFLLAGCAGSPAAAQSNAAPNLPASLRLGGIIKTDS